MTFIYWPLRQNKLPELAKMVTNINTFEQKIKNDSSIKIIFTHNKHFIFVFTFILQFSAVINHYRYVSFLYLLFIIDKIYFSFYYFFSYATGYPTTKFGHSQGDSFVTKQPKGTHSLIMKSGQFM